MLFRYVIRVSVGVSLGESGGGEQGHPYAVFFSVLSFVTMLWVRHGDVKPEKKKTALENFDVDD